MSDFHPMPHDRIAQELAAFGLSPDAIRSLDARIEWVALFQQGRPDEAYARLREEGPLPEMTAHIRAEPGERESTSLRQLQYMIAWTAREKGLTGVQVPELSTGLRVAVVGGGPAGLAATVRLLEEGHGVEIVEREDRLGGAPALVYDEDRLPDPADEIDALLSPAVQAGRLAVSLGREIPHASLLKSFDAVLLATGVWNEPSLGKAPGVWTALNFLKAVRSGKHVEVPSHVALLCGGDAAMDAAVVARKRGAKHLRLLFQSPRESAHWHLPEAWFDTEGVEACFDVRPAGYRLDPDGSVTGVTLEENETVDAEMVIEAIGLHPDETNATPDQLFAAGALVNGGASVQQCMREGFDTADMIDRHLRRKSG